MVAQPRCQFALALISLNTRCRLKPGHNGPHEGRGLKKYPYQHIKWFKGDGREFLTERDDEYAWSERKNRSNSGKPSSPSGAS